VEYSGYNSRSCRAKLYKDEFNVDLINVREQGVVAQLFLVLTFVFLKNFINAAKVRLEMNNQRLKEVDFAKGCSIIGVILIHGTSQAVTKLPVSELFHHICLWINKWGNFSVPSFIMLSSLVLVYQHDTTLSVNEIILFLSKRIKYIFIPYILWSIGYFYINNHFSSGIYNYLTGLVLSIVQGTANYHLYFIILIMQYYLLLPILIWFLRKLELPKIYLLIAAVIIPTIADLFYNFLNFSFDKSSICITYFDAYLIGALIGFEYKEISKWIDNHLRIIEIITIGFTILHLAVNEKEANGFYVLPIIHDIVVHLFSIFTTLSILGIARLKSNNSIISGVSNLGRKSLGIYFVHPFFLDISSLESIITINSMLYKPVTIIRIIFVFLISLLWVNLVKRSRGSWLLLGK
jgi:surface polysaccharide O-acyltransferase-like enzyme